MLTYEVEKAPQISDDRMIIIHGTNVLLHCLRVEDSAQSHLSHATNYQYTSSSSSSSSSSYKALQPIQGSGLRNHFLPSVSILCYILPVMYFHAFYIFQKSSFQRILGLSIGLFDMGFQLLIFLTLLSPVMRSPY
jgi:hypothetical protein